MSINAINYIYLTDLSKFNQSYVSNKLRNGT